MSPKIINSLEIFSEAVEIYACGERDDSRWIFAEVGVYPLRNDADDAVEEHYIHPAELLIRDLGEKLLPLYLCPVVVLYEQ